MYDLVIIGAGPAGVAAGVYAARKKLKTLLIAEEFGGQSAVSETIYNWIGTPEISGNGLAEAFKKHLEEYADNETLTLLSRTRVEKLERIDDFHFKITDNKGKTHETKTVLISSGSSRKELKVPGAKEWENRGLTYCASCDGPLFTDMDVVVVGGGNAGFESVAQLAAYCKSVTLLHRNSSYKAEPLTVEKVLKRDNVRGILNADILEVYGENFITGVRYKNKETNTEELLPVQGVFVEIGQIPNSQFVKGVIDTNEHNQIIADPYTQKTSLLGVWAAGDVTDVRYHQNNISAGDAVKAVEDIYKTLYA
ncbi:MAG: FAD-dependent oxidoreductase [Candidatus Pacebacteria bacterium]|nr:FAD-dependent oxidoreductase [Candidatus Paceibacterota bacterium]